MSEEKDGKKEEQYKVFVGGLSYKLDDIGLREAFERFGPDEAQVILDKETGRSRAFGFVIFKDKTAMEDAIREMHESELDGRKISCRRAVPQSDVKPGTPAFALNGGGYGGRRDSGRRYESRDSRGGYGGDRYGGGGGGYERGYERGYGGGYGGGYGADPRYASYERGYAGGYERDPYPRDPYAREPSRDAYAYSGSYAHEPAYDRSYGYDARSAYPPAEYSRGSAYDDRGAGPDRSRYASAPRAAAPYDRPTDGRRSDPPRPR